jgi:hypothetical protein
MWVPFFHMVVFPDQFPHSNHIIQHELLLHLQIKSYSELILIICTLSSTLQTHSAKQMWPNHASLLVPLTILCCLALLYSILLCCLNVCLALTWHSTSNLFLKRQQEISKMVEMGVLKAFPLLFLLLRSLLAVALTSKHLSLVNIVSWLSLPTLLWTACLGNSRY